MYSYEILQYLQEHNFTVDNEQDFLAITSPELNPQIDYRRYDERNGFYYMGTNDNHFFIFKVITQKENKERGR